MRKIDIFDTTLRDGEQVPGASLNASQKMEIARQLARMKVDVIEAGFPISSPGDFEAVSQIAEEVEGPTIAALARAIEKDIISAYEAVKHAAKPRVHVFLSTSDIHIEHQFRKTRAEILQQAIDCVKRAKDLTEDVEYSPMDATRSDFDYLCETIEKVIDAGATVINVPDTVGYVLPQEFGNLIKRIRERVSNIERAKISVHCHNDLGQAVGNSLAAVQHGADQVECTINGIGERAGNAALEEVVMTIKTRGDFFNAETDVDRTQIARTSRMVSTIMGIPIQPNKAIVGSNAFAHSSGIHQDGILKHRQTYEIIRPEDVGITEHSLVLTSRSGRHALRHRLTELGYGDISNEEFEAIHERFLGVADKKKEVTDQDLEALMGEELSTVPQTYQLDSFVAVSGHTMPSATVRLKTEDKVIQESASGDGPVDAIYFAINSITGKTVKVEDYSVRSVSSGKEALGEAMVRVRSNDMVVTGRASGTDVLDASARAYVQAINKIIAREGAKKDEPDVDKRMTL